MSAGLPSQQRIDAPPAVDIDLQSGRLEAVEQLDRIRLRYFSDVHRVYGSPELAHR
jgi:hypothetical protein